MELSLLTYNIHKGFGPGSRRCTLPQIRELLVHYNPDIICLQEVVGHHAYYKHLFGIWPSVPQYEYLAEGHWKHLAYAKTRQTKFMHHGNVVLSKIPIVGSQHIDISTNKIEQRALLVTQIKVSPHHTINCCCTHLNLLQRGRAKQIETIVYNLWQAATADPLILAGDFNDWRKKVCPLLGEELGLIEAFSAVGEKHAKTLSSRLLSLPLDRIYVRGVEVKEIKVINSRSVRSLSDHLPVIATLKL